jgi:two-component system, NarL family, nitrate/nitrite response regulator NarL
MRHQPLATLVRVHVCDDTRVHTELLADALKRDGCLQVTTSPPGADSLASHINASDIDVLLISSNLDQQAGRGFEVLRGLRSMHADLKAVMLLDGSQGETILEAFRSGARGIFSKNDPVSSLAKCLRKVHEGQVWANSEQVKTLVEALASSHNIRAVDARGLNLLSKREMEIVRGVAQGLSNREIAARLRLSQHTVKNCLFRIFDKLGVSSRVELLFMTLSQEHGAQSALQHFMNERAHESLRDEATLIACQEAAAKGVLIAQFELAQFYSMCRADPDSAIEAYTWYSVVAARIAQAFQAVAKNLTLEQLLKAEALAAERMSKKNGSSVTAAAKSKPMSRAQGIADAPRRRSGDASAWA